MKSLETEIRKDDTIKTVKTAAFSSIANILTVLVGIVVVPLISRVLSESDLGIASTYLANRNIVIAIAMLGVSSYSNFAMIEYQKDRINYFYTICCFCFGMTLVLYLAMFPFKDYLTAMFGIDDFLFFWFPFSVLVCQIYTIASNFCIFLNYTRIVFLTAILIGVAGPLLSVLFSYLLPSDNYLGRVVGLDLPMICVAGTFFVWIFFLHHHKEIKWEYLKKALLFGIPIIPHYFSLTILTQSDLVMITAFLDTADSGLYSMGHTIGVLAYTAIAQVMSSWSPWVYRRMKEGDAGSIDRNYTYIMALGVILSAGLIGIAPEVVSLLLPPAYFCITSIIPPLVLATFFQFLYLFYYDILYFNHQPVKIAVAAVCAAAINIVLNFTFIPIVGFEAACYTTLISYFIMFSLTAFFSRKYGAIDYYNPKRILLYITIMCIYTFVGLCFIDSILIRYAAYVLVLLLLFFIHRNSVTAFLHRSRNKRSLPREMN